MSREAAEDPVPSLRDGGARRRPAPARACCSSAPSRATGCRRTLRRRSTLVQGFRPLSNALESAGIDVKPRAGRRRLSTARWCCAAGTRAERDLASPRRCERVEPGGMIVVAGSKDDGMPACASGWRRLVALDGHLPKYHGVAFWFRRPDDAEAAIAALRDTKPALIDGRFVAAPGMFSHDRVDAGSRLLAAHLPDDCKGAPPISAPAGAICRPMLAERTRASRRSTSTRPTTIRWRRAKATSRRCRMRREPASSGTISPARRSRRATI